VTAFTTALAHDGWLAFNEHKWGVRAERVTYPEPGGPLNVVLYLDRRGRVVLPRLNPYLPVSYEQRPSVPYRATRAWTAAAGAMAADLRRRGLGSTVAFQSNVRDLRPLAWRGFRLGVNYTVTQELPIPEAHIDPDVRRRVRRATEAKYRCERTLAFDDVIACVAETERRQGFRYALTISDLDLLASTMGEAFRAYVCYSADGRPVAAQLLLHQEGGQAIDWVNGTALDELASGATQLLTKFSLADVLNAGAVSIDWEGANIPSVSASKERWGGQIEPWFTIEPLTIRNVARWAYAQVRYR
jgi:hypothetical protein